MAVTGVSFFRLPWLLAALLVVFVGATLFCFDPAHVAVYPVCYFHKTTGLLCPGCGGLRAAHQLLHGHIAAAFRLNALFVVALPLIAGRMIRYVTLHLRDPSASFAISQRWLWAALFVCLAFGVVRNLL